MRTRERQVYFSVANLQSGRRWLERRRRHVKDYSKKTYDALERRLRLNEWSDKHKIPMVLPLVYSTWVLNQATRIAEMSGQNTEFYSADLGHKDAEGLLRTAFEDTLFEPINMEELGRMLRAERLKMQSQLGSYSNRLGPFFDYVVDLLGVSRQPNLSSELKSGLKALIRLETFI